ncbi:enoyl-CoA hydratase/isomerase family protein [Maribacter sp. TH_r10]|uniref:Enoyl-CoA hydratase/isomerase family protein n=1 Tax=Maribacter luteus TaxID=2594478 RepID=A0A6I2MH52_9FLAO|nr:MULTISPECIES: enoyl-CoA hydratase/isomerase family protein [Maribacter]MDV7137698.1 enoyl-CoA hydratase/isomerase family protein [Maribacter sp. TH_r10]MRX63133.1 enoyl-CoA hydratase/isomerase family protein [Maribacter luteus]
MNKTFKHIIVKSEDKIGFLIFNRPTQLNAMNREMMDEIIEAIRLINTDDSINVGVITGSGRAFMAGADIKEYGDQTPEEFKSFQDRGIKLYETIENASKPWIAAVNGFALGGGFEIALSCDMILASATAKMGLPEVFLSLVPGGGGTQRLIQKVGINRAKELLFFGGQYTAEKLYDWGIVNQVIPEDNFDAEIVRFAEKLSRRSPSAIKELKKLAQLSLSALPFDQKITEEGKVVTKLFYGAEAKKAIQDFIAKS